MIPEQSVDTVWFNTWVKQAQIEFCVADVVFNLPKHSKNNWEKKEQKKNMSVAHVNYKPSANNARFKNRKAAFQKKKLKTKQIQNKYTTKAKHSTLS